MPLTASFGSHAPRIAQRLAKMRRQRFAERFWSKDPALWKPGDKAGQQIRDRLGWLTVIPTMQEDCGVLLAFAEEVRQAGFTHALLLGMGGSSLSADVFRHTFGAGPGALKLHVLDSTNPDLIRNLERKLPLDRTLFLVSTKSGTTTETLCFFRYFYEKVRGRKGERAGENFVAITDAGSPLVSLGAEHRFRRTFLNPSDIGGRFSALSYFGLVPAALAGVDIRKLLERAASLLPAGGPGMATEENPAIQLGSILGEWCLCGRDKITFSFSPGLAAFGYWVEQLLAESTGKEGKGLLPIEGEPLASPAAYGADRAFVHLRLESSPQRNDTNAASKLKALERAGHPVLRIFCRDVYDLGREFFRWEIAAAVAGSVLKINPFDEPNVQESKDNTKRLLEHFESQGSLPEEAPLLRESGIGLYGSAPAREMGKRPGARQRAAPKIQEVLGAHFRQAKPGDYVALLAYLTPNAASEQWLQKIRARLHRELGVATTVGYGPRYLHSTGQFHKGGPPAGVFLELTATGGSALPIPGLGYPFGVLERAQALGDFEALRSRKRPVLRLDLGRNPEQGLRQVARWIQEALALSTPAKRR